MNEENIRITVEFDDTKKIVDITKDAIKLNGKNMTIPDCVKAIGISKEFGNLVASYAAKVVLNKN